MLKPITEAAGIARSTEFIQEIEDLILQNFDQVSPKFYATKQKIVVFVAQKSTINSPHETAIKAIFCSSAHFIW